MIASNFDKSGTGGREGSKIDEQDGVGVRLILEILVDLAEGGVSPEVIQSTRISCEVGDDLVVYNDAELRLISVKSAALEPKAVVEESRRLAARMHTLDQRGKSLRMLCLVGPYDPETGKLASALEDLHNVLGGPVTASTTIAEWQTRNGVKVVRLVEDASGKRRRSESTETIEQPETFAIRTLTHRMDTEQTRAELSRLLRKAAPLTDFSDLRVDGIVQQMMASLGEARRTRKTILLSDFVRLLGDVVLPPSLQGQLSMYRLTKYGYSIAHSRKALKRDQELVRVATKKARMRFRGSLRTGLLADLTRGPVRCLECGHALMANRYGFGAGGIMCPACGFAPFMSVLYACECGEPNLVVAQPAMVQAELMMAISRAASKRCSECERSFDPTHFTLRVFALPLPWPPEDFKHQDLIDARIRAGLSQPIKDEHGNITDYSPDALGKEELQGLDLDRTEHG